MQSRFAVQRSHTVPCGPREPIRTANDPVEAETDARRPPASAKGFVKRGPAGWGAAAGVQFNQGFAEIKEAGVLVRVPARIGSGWQPPAPKPPWHTRSSSRTSPPAKSRYAYVVRTISRRSAARSAAARPHTCHCRPGRRGHLPGGPRHAPRHAGGPGYAPSSAIVPFLRLV